MTHTGDEQRRALLQRAQESLHSGASPGTVFAELSVNVPDVRAAAIAVCVAAGTSHADAENRWAADCEPLPAEVQDCEAAELGRLLDLAGFFDLHRPASGHEEQIRHQLSQALSAHRRWRSGLACGIIRALQTGRFIDALVLMATYAPRRPAVSPNAYWSHLLAAANMLATSGDSRIEAIVLLCRQHLDESA